MIFFRYAAFVVLAVAALPDLAHAQTPDRAAFNRGFATDVVLPAFENLVAGAETLRVAADAYCAAPDAARQDALHAGFDAASDAWMRVQMFRLGPLAGQQRAERFAYWPERRPVIDKQLNQLLAKPDLASVTAESLSTASVAVQGLPALERLLYGEAAARMAPDSPDRTPRCALVTGIAGNLKAIADELVAQWQAELADPVKSGQPFAANPDEAMAQLFTNLLTGLQVAGDQKLKAALTSKAETAKPKLTEQWRSGRSLRNIRINLESLRDSVLKPGGFAKILAPADRAALTAKVSKTFDNALASVAAVPEPLDKTVADPAHRRDVGLALFWVSQLHELFGRELAPALGISLGFNELDGDGA